MQGEHLANLTLFVEIVALVAGLATTWVALQTRASVLELKVEMLDRLKEAVTEIEQKAATRNDFENLERRISNLEGRRHRTA